MTGDDAEPEGRATFIRAQTRPLSVPLVPEITLHLADEATALWQATESELGRIGLPPPFWAFAWAGGQALARYVLDHPESVRGRRVLDLGAGSGLVAIAAAQAGATEIVAADIDPFAAAAMALNAAQNSVTLSPWIGDVTRIGQDETAPAGTFGVILAGDICYERGMAARLIPWLQRQARTGTRVILGDPGRAYLPSVGLTELAVYDVPVTRDLEDREIKRTRVWRMA